MGLDMYLYSMDKMPDSEVDFVIGKDAEIEPEEIGYWRKHPNLHGWMERLYREKGGKEEFNCVNLLLTESDLKKLKNDLLLNNLEATSGFFFGASSGSKEEVLRDLEFVDEALKEVNIGNCVFYTSWW